jgi:hypothetical protein
MNKSSKDWINLAIFALAFSGIYSIIIVLLRVPGLSKFFIDPNIFKTALIIHVDLSVYVWMVCIANSIMTMNIRHEFIFLNRLLLYIAFLSIILITFSPLISGGNPIINNYIPIIENFFFILGLSFFTCISFIISLMSLFNRLDGSIIDYASKTIAVIFLIAFACLLLSFHKVFELTYSYPIDINYYYELIFWGFGHILQFLYVTILEFIWIMILLNSTFVIARISCSEDQKIVIQRSLQGDVGIQKKSHLMLNILIKILISISNWITTLCLKAKLVMTLGKFKYVADLSSASHIYKILICSNIVFVIFVPIIYFLYPIDSFYLHEFFTEHMRYLGSISVICIFIAIVFDLLKNPQNFSKLAFIVFFCSASLFFAGGIIAIMISGTNVTIPAHYHGSIVGISIGMMGYVYFTLGLAESSICRKQIILYWAGQLIHITGLAISGGYGVLRKSPEMELSFAAKITMGIMGLGGLIAIIAGLLFVVICLRKILK